jgi:hypothetical protein
MKRSGSNYQLVPNKNLKESPLNQFKIFKYNADKKGLKFLAFNESNGKFAVDTGYNSLVVNTMIATKIQANFMGLFEYDDYRNTARPINLTPEINVPKPVAPIPAAVQTTQTTFEPLPPLVQPKPESSGDLLLATIAGLAAFLLL